MAYGRLDVFWPDGKFETYLLDQATISVGRSSGNSVTLDTDTISRYHFSITHENSQVFITDLDSANGTFVDGSRLPSNEPALLRGGEEVQIGHLRMNFHVLDENPTMPVSTLAEDTQRIEKETVEFRIDLQLPHIAVTPGSYTSIELIIANTGADTRQYTVSVTGLPDGWARVNRPVVEIDPDDSTPVLINIKPLRRSDSKPGVYFALVTVRAKDQPDSMLEAEFKVTILPFSGFGMALMPRRLNNGEKARLHIHNQGSGPLPLQITGRALDDDLIITMRPSQITLAPGQRAQIEVEPKPQRSRMFGSAREHVFDVLVQSQDPAHFLAPVRGRLLDTPPLPGWGLPALGLLLLLAVGLVVFGLAALLQPVPQPVITRFIVNNDAPRLARGEPLQVEWTVSNSEAVSVEVNGTTLNRQTLSTLDEIEVNGQFPTDELFGDVTITLVAEHRGQTTRQQRQVLIYERARIDAFTASPSEIIRHAQQTLTLRWNAPGAVGAPSVSGLELFVGDPARMPIITGDSLQVSGVAETDLLLVLNVQGEYDTPEPQTLFIRALDPECTSGPGEVNLLAAPAPDAEPVATLTALTTRAVDGRDATSAWLRFPLPDGTFGWGRREDFRCSDRFRIEDLRTVTVAGTLSGGAVPPPLTPVVTPTTAP